MTRSFGGGPDRPHKEKKPDLRQSDPDFDSRLDSRLSRYEADDDSRVQAVRVDFGKRLVAAIIDGVAAMLVAFVFTIIPFVGMIITFSIAMTVYLLVRDYFFEGRGIGKNLMGLQVVDLRSGLPCTFLQAIRRNSVILGPILLMFVVTQIVTVINLIHHIPGNVQDVIRQVVESIGTLYTIVVIPYEAYRVYSRPDGRRFGDSFAGTAVVEAPMDFSKPVPRK